MGHFKGKFNDMASAAAKNTEPDKARFVCASKEQIDEIKANRILSSTKRNTQWGVKTYEAWAEFRNSKKKLLWILMDQCR